MHPSGHCWVSMLLHYIFCCSCSPQGRQRIKRQTAFQQTNYGHGALSLSLSLCVGSIGSIFWFVHCSNSPTTTIATTASARAKLGLLSPTDSTILLHLWQQPSNKRTNEQTMELLTYGAVSLMFL